MSKIEKGWCFYTADFSLQAAGNSTKGTIMLVRDQENTEKWHRLPDELKDADDGPELYMAGRGETIEDAIASANLAARRAIKL